MADKPTIALDETDPANNKNPQLGAADIRTYKIQNREVMGVDHEFPSSGKAEANGRHNKVTLQEVSAPSEITDNVILYAKVPPAGTKVELFAKDEDGNAVQITSLGAIGIPGEIKAYAGIPEALTGWLICDGAEVSQTTFAALYAAIGNAFNDSPAGGNFNIPDGRGRALIGVGTGPGGLTPRAMAAEVGEENHVLTEAELATHVHTFNNGDRINLEQAGSGLKCTMVKRPEIVDQ